MWSEQVVGFSRSDVQLGGAGGEVVSMLAHGSAYTATVQPAGVGLVTVKVHPRKQRRVPECVCIQEQGAVLVGPYKRRGQDVFVREAGLHSRSHAKVTRGELEWRIRGVAGASVETGVKGRGIGSGGIHDLDVLRLHVRQFATHWADANVTRFPLTTSAIHVQFNMLLLWSVLRTTLLQYTSRRMMHVCLVR